MPTPRNRSPLQEPPAFLDELDSEKSWVSFIELCLGTIDRAARRATVDEDTADDIAAEVLERLRADWPELLRRFIESGDGAPFRVWLSVVARRGAIDVLRSRHGRKAVPRSVQRLEPWKRQLWSLTFQAERPLTEAADLLREAGAWQGELSELAEAYQELDRNLPDHAKVPLAPPPVARPTGEAEESIPSEDLDPATELAHGGTRGALSEVLQELLPEERFLVRVYFLEGATAKGVAAATSLGSPERVYEKIKAVMRKLRSAVESRGLGPKDLVALGDFDWTEALGKP